MSIRTALDKHVLHYSGIIAQTVVVNDSYSFREFEQNQQNLLYCLEIGPNSFIIVLYEEVVQSAAQLSLRCVCFSVS